MIAADRETCGERRPASLARAALPVRRRLVRHRADLWQAVLAAPLEARERLANDKVIGLQGPFRSTLDEAIEHRGRRGHEGMPDQLERAACAARERAGPRRRRCRGLTTDLVDPEPDACGARGAAAPPARAHARQRHQSARAARCSRRRPQQSRRRSRCRRPRRPTRRSYTDIRSCSTLRGNYLECLRYLEDVERAAVAHLLVAARALDRRVSRQRHRDRGCDA